MCGPSVTGYLICICSCVCYLSFFGLAFSQLTRCFHQHTQHHSHSLLLIITITAITIFSIFSDSILFLFSSKTYHSWNSIFNEIPLFLSIMASAPSMSGTKTLLSDTFLLIVACALIFNVMFNHNLILFHKLFDTQH